MAIIIGATKKQYLDDAVQAMDIHLTSKEVAYLEEPYTAHEIVGALASNPVGMLQVKSRKSTKQFKRFKFMVR